MGQYEIAKLVHESDTPLSRQDIITKTGLSRGAVSAGIRQVREKGYIREVDEGYIFTATNEELENMRPLTISELKEKDEF